MEDCQASQAVGRIERLGATTLEPKRVTRTLGDVVDTLVKACYLALFNHVGEKQSKNGLKMLNINKGKDDLMVVVVVVVVNGMKEQVRH